MLERKFFGVREYDLASAIAKRIFTTDVQAGLLAASGDLMREPYRAGDERHRDRAAGVLRSCFGYHSQKRPMSSGNVTSKLQYACFH